MLNIPKPETVSPAVWRAVMAHDNHQAQVGALARMRGMSHSDARDLLMGNYNKPVLTKDVYAPRNERLQARSGGSTPDQRMERARQCRAMYDGGKTLVEIAAEMRLTMRTVRDYINATKPKNERVK